MIILVCGQIFLFSCVFCQENVDDEKGKQFIRAESFYAAGHYDSAAFRYRYFIELLKPASSGSDPIASPEREQEVKNMYAAFLKWGICLIHLSEYDSAFQILTRGLNLSECDLESENKLKNEFLFQLGNCSVLLGENNEGIEYYQQALGSAMLTGSLLTGIYQNLGSIYFLQEDYENAIIHFQKALFACQSGKVNDPGKTAELLVNLGSVYVEKNEYSRALLYYWNAKKIYSGYREMDSLFLSRIWVNLGGIYARARNTDSAFYCYRNALKYFKDGDPSVINDRFLLFRNLAELFLNTGEEDSSNYYLDQAISLYERKDKRSRNMLAGLFRLKGISYENQGNWNEALLYFDRAWNLVGPGGIFSVNPPDIHKISPGDLIESFRIIECRGRVLQKKALNADSAGFFLGEAFADYYLGFQMMDPINRILLREESRIFFNESVKNCISGAMETGYQMKILGFPGYDQKLFEISEGSRSKVLLASVHEEMVKQAAGIPDSLARRENQIRKDISYYSRRCFGRTGLQTGENIDVFLQDLERLTGLYQQNDSLIKEMEKASPVYCEQKNEKPVSPFSRVQQKLEPDEALLEYYMGDSALFVVILSEESFAVEKISMPLSFREMVKEYYRMLKSADLDQFYRISQKLYAYLIDSIKVFLENKTRLIIIPSEELAMIPFETLSHGAMPFKTSDRRETVRYLIQDFDISYHFSASLWEKEKEEKGNIRNKPTFAGFAPVFHPLDHKKISIQPKEGNNSQAYKSGKFSREFTYLPYTEQEILQIAGVFRDHGMETGVYINSRATKQIFCSQAPLYAILQIATHGLLDQDFPERSGLAFYPGEGESNPISGDDDILYLSDIYQLRLDADLLVLSACATGTGKLFRMEGIMALTRGFIYAGVNNIIYTLWNVTDKITKELMVDFYREILSGERYSAALRKAKLKMLEKPETSIPTIWAPYVITGE